jgi:hypothetical protein
MMVCSLVRYYPAIGRSPEKEFRPCSSMMASCSTLINNHRPAGQGTLHYRFFPMFFILLRAAIMTEKTRIKSVPHHSNV